MVTHSANLRIDGIMVFLAPELSSLGVCERLAFWGSTSVQPIAKTRISGDIGATTHVVEEAIHFINERWCAVLRHRYRSVSQQEMDDGSNLFSRTCTSRSEYVIVSTGYALSEGSWRVRIRACIVCSPLEIVYGYSSYGLAKWRFCSGGTLLLATGAKLLLGKQYTVLCS